MRYNNGRAPSLDYMHESPTSMQPMIDAATSIVLHIVRLADPSFGKALSRLRPPYFMVSWLITWFAHDLSPEDAASVFEYCLQREAAAIVPAYLSAAVLLCKRDSILVVEGEMHQELKSLPAKCDINEVFCKADELLRQMPPATIAGRFRELRGTLMAVSFERLPRIRLRWAALDAGEFLWRHRVLVLGLLVLPVAALCCRHLCRAIHFWRE